VKSESLAEIRAARRANASDLGLIRNAALDRRLQAMERAECIRLLGWKPEPTGIGPCHPDAYAASCGEMIAMLREKTEEPT
jgi:hypothetical protein